MKSDMLSPMRSRLHQIFKVVFTKPADPSTPEGRSQERYRRAALTTLVLMTARVSNILIGLITVPITLNYLGEDLFGIWTVLTSIVGILSFYDFGIGVGLRNMLIECVGKEDYEKPRELIGNALIVLTILAVLMIGFVYIVGPLFSWGSIIKCKNPASVPEILPSLQAVISMFALGLPIAQLQNIANAYQRGYWGYLCFLFGRVVSFLFILWCVKAEQPLWLLAGGYVGLPYFVTLIGWVIFLIASPTLRPWPVRLDWTLTKRLFSIGFFVLINHLSFAMINTSAIMLIANTIGASNSIPYSLAQQLLGTSTIFTASLLIGVSAAVGEAWYRKEYGWIKKNLRRSEITVLLFGVAPLVLFLLVGQTVIHWWTKSPEAVPSFSLLLVLVLFTAASTIGSIYNDCLMAMNHVRFIALTKLVAGIIVVLGGYTAGVLSQSPTVIAFIQFSVGALIPALLFWWKMVKLLTRATDNHFRSDHLTQDSSENYSTIPKVEMLDISSIGGDKS
jgi:O-antigen/teichoic acid export membrane protein